MLPTFVTGGEVRYPVSASAAACDRCDFAADLISRWLNLHHPAIRAFMSGGGRQEHIPDECTDLRIVLHAHTFEGVAHDYRTRPVLGVFCHGVPADYDPGHFDEFLCLPFDGPELGVRLRRLLPRATPDAGDIEAFKTQYKMQSLIGSSEALMRVLRRVPHVASSDASVLLQGETGTGKELVARAIHYASKRRSKPFIPVNCSALPDHLFENEMFGHARGAYTDAATNEPGLVAVSEGGTLFLDEIDTLSPQCQAKMLRFLQTREYRPLGAARAVTGDVRFVAATNADLAERVSTRAFRADLFHRLNVLRLSIPPLASRIEDIPALAKHFLSIYAAQCGRVGMRLGEAATQKLLRYSWPGNIRELESVIQRAALLAAGQVIQAQEMELADDEANPFTRSTLQEAKAEAVEHFEKSFLTGLLATHHGNVSAAARAAGKDRRAFQRLLQKHGVDRRIYAAPDQLY